MKEEAKKLQLAMNDYLLSTNAEDMEIYRNLSIFYDFAFELEKGLSEYFSSYDETIDYSKITQVPLFEKIKLIENFYKEVGIDFDLDKYINDGTIDFVYYDYFNNNEDTEDKKYYCFSTGTNCYEGSKRTINICNNGFITDVLVAVHELSHFRDQPEDGRNQVNDLFTEALAYAEELICMDYLSELGYVEDMILYKKDIFNIAHHRAGHMRPIYKMFLVHKDLGDISEENYEYYYGNKDEYESILKFMSRFIKNKNFQLFYYTRYVVAYVLGPYMYLQYKKDKSFFKKIIDLHDRINDSSPIDCFKIMGLQNLGEEDREKLKSALDEIKLELDEIGMQKSK